MPYTLRLHVPEGTEPAQRAVAERLFCQTLEHALGGAHLVPPVYRAYLGMLAQHGDPPDTEALTADQRTVLEHWQRAEAAALAAVFGPHRHLDEGGYELRLSA